MLVRTECGSGWMLSQHKGKGPTPEEFQAAKLYKVDTRLAAMSVLLWSVKGLSLDFKFMSNCLSSNATVGDPSCSILYRTNVEIWKRQYLGNKTILSHHRPWLCSSLSIYLVLLAQSFCFHVSRYFHRILLV